MLSTADNAPPPVSARRTPKVCIVDSRPSDYRHLLEAECGGEPQLTLLRRGREALRTALGPRIDLWVVNAQLADMSGLDLCELLRARDRTTAVWLISDQYDPQVERQAWLRGASLFCTKPLEPTHLAYLAGERIEPGTAEHC